MQQTCLIISVSEQVLYSITQKTQTRFAFLTVFYFNCAIACCSCIDIPGEGADIIQPLGSYSSRGKLIPLHGMTEAFSAKNQRIAWQNMQKENDMKPADNNSNMQNKNKGTPVSNTIKIKATAANNSIQTTKKNSRSQHSRFPCRKFRESRERRKSHKAAGA